MSDYQVGEHTVMYGETRSEPKRPAMSDPDAATTAEPDDAEQAVAYWRGRWAATASSLTDAAGVIQDIAEHAAPLGEDADGFVTTGYVVSVGAIHRALGWLRGSDHSG